MRLPYTAMVCNTIGLFFLKQAQAESIGKLRWDNGIILLRILLAEIHIKDKEMRLRQDSEPGFAEVGIRARAAA